MYNTVKLQPYKPCCRRLALLTDRREMRKEVLKAHLFFVRLEF